MTVNKAHLLSASAREQIDKWNHRYPPEQKCSGVFEALRLVQEENGGSLTTDLMDAVADYLEMPHIAVYEVVTFYSMYNLTPVGRHVIEVCTNISCMLSGAKETLAYFKNRLGIELNETTADGRFTLKEVECLGACDGAPMCQIGKKYYEHLTAEKIDKLVEELKHGE